MGTLEVGGVVGEVVGAFLDFFVQALLAGALGHIIDGHVERGGVGEGTVGEVAL